MKSLKMNKAKLTDVTFEEKTAGYAPEMKEHKDEFPYGLRICLNNETIKMLALKELPEVGETMNLKAMVKVVSTSEYEAEDTGEQYTMDLQITDMELSSPKAKVDVEKLYKQSGGMELSEAGE